MFSIFKVDHIKDFVLKRFTPFAIRLNLENKIYKNPVD